MVPSWFGCFKVLSLIKCYKFLSPLGVLGFQAHSSILGSRPHLGILRSLASLGVSYLLKFGSAHVATIQAFNGPKLVWAFRGSNLVQVIWCLGPIFAFYGLNPFQAF